MVLLAILAGCTRTPQQKRDRHVQAGDHYAATGDYARAVLEFRSAAGIDPTNAGIHHKLGKAYLAGKELPQAAKEFQRAAELDPKLESSTLKLAQLTAMSGGRSGLEDALERTESILAERSDSAALGTAALLDMGLGKLDDAVERLEEAVEHYPADVQAAMALSGLRLARQDRAGAGKVLRDAIHANPKEIRVQIALARMLQSLHRLDEARQAYLSALAIAPDNATALIGLARLQARARQWSQADQTYRKVSGLPDKAYRPVHALFLMESGRQPEAIQELEQIRAADRANRTVRAYLIAAYAQAGRRGDAAKLIDSGLAENPNDTDLLLGGSRLSLNSGDTVAAERDLYQALHFTPDSAVAHYLLSMVKERKGEVAAQKQSLAEALRFNRSLLAARFELAMLLAAHSGRQSAIETMDEAPKSQRATRPFLVRRNWVLASLGDWDGVAEGVRLGMARGSDPELLLQDGLVKLERKRHAAARQSFEEILKADPENFQALQGLAKSYLAEGQPAAALARVREYAMQRPQSAAAQHLLGTVMLANRQAAKANVAFESAKKADPSYAFADLAAAQSQIAAKDWGTAKQTLGKLLAADPGNAAARLLLASTEELSGNPRAAIGHYRQAIELAPDNPVALNNLAYLLAGQPGKLDEALGYSRRAVNAEPAQLAYQDTQGWILCRQGNYAEAVKHLEKASRLDIASVQFHLAYAYLKSGNPAAGWKTFEKASKLDPAAPEGKLFLELRTP